MKNYYEKDAVYASNESLALMAEISKDFTELETKNKRLCEALDEALMAILYTRDYVGEEKLPPIAGWSWYDAGLNISKIIPDSDAVNQFKLRVNNELLDVPKQGDGS